MANLVTGAIGLILIVVFLGKYAITLNAIPLWIIIGGTLVLIAYDYYLSVHSAREAKHASRS